MIILCVKLCEYGWTSLNFMFENLANISPFLILLGHGLDILARIPLWKDGLDYRHGTGHGIGSYLNVHEGNEELSLFLYCLLLFCI